MRTKIGEFQIHRYPVEVVSEHMGSITDLDSSIIVPLGNMANQSRQLSYSWSPTGRVLRQHSDYHISPLDAHDGSDPR